MPAQKSLTHLGAAASACLLLLAGCRSDPADRSGALYSHYRPRPTIVDQPPPEYSSKEALSVQFALARTLEGEKNWKGAENIYRRILEQNPKHADAAHRLAILCDRQNRFKESDKYFRLALKSRPGDPNLFCDVGYSHYRQRRWADAEMNLKQATAIEKTHARAHNHLGLLYAQMDRRKDALAEFKLAGCNASQAHTNVALVLSLNDRLEAAQQEYVAALNADPTSDEVRSRLQKIESVLAMSNPAAPARAQKSQVQVVRHTVESPRKAEGGRRKAESGKPKAEGGKRKAEGGQTHPSTLNAQRTARSAAPPAPFPSARKTQPVVAKPAGSSASTPRQDRFVPPSSNPWQLQNVPKASPPAKGRVRLLPSEPPHDVKIQPRNAAADDRPTSPKNESRPFVVTGFSRSRDRLKPVTTNLPVLSQAVDNGLRPISHETPAKSQFTPVRTEGNQLQPIRGSRPTRTATEARLIDIEAIVPRQSPGRSRLTVIE